MSIMHNLFAKIASIYWVIKLFGNGNQLKSLVPLLDVTRCLKFVSENDIKNNKDLSANIINIKNLE